MFVVSSKGRCYWSGRIASGVRRWALGSWGVLPEARSTPKAQRPTPNARRIERKTANTGRGACESSLCPVRLSATQWAESDGWMAAKVFVGNLDFNTTRTEVQDLFTQVGAVRDVFLPMDRESGRPRGFAFVEYENDADAAAAIEKFNGYQLGG